MASNQLPCTALRRAEENLRRFVAKARFELKPYGEIDWDAVSWDVTAFEKKRGGQSRKTFRIVFTRLDETGSRLLEGKAPFERPFDDFVKAVIVHRHDAQPKCAQNQMGTVRAARYLHEELAAADYDPAALTLDHFIGAIARAKRREKLSSCHGIGAALAGLAGIINRYGLAKAKIDFKNPIPRQRDDNRVDERATRRRAEKLPSDAALQGLAKISSLVTEETDVIRMRVVELLIAGGGFRINELLSVPADCLVERPAKDHLGSPLLDANDALVMDVGIRYWPEKGGPVDIKWISTPMVGNARRAIRDLSRLTQGARDLARWLRENPGRAWLGPDFDRYNLRDIIPCREIAKVIGVAGRVQAWAWLKTHHVPFEKRRFGTRVLIGARRRDLEAALLKLQASGPMVAVPVRQELDESLFVCFLNQFHQNRGTNRCIVATVTEQQIADFLDERDCIRPIFDRFGITEEDGSPIRITSHMFRHWANTLAQEGGMAQHEIARWMGRRRIDDNATYDHVSGIQMAENARELFRKGEAVGGLKDLYDRLPPAEREAFLASQIRTAHTTAYGLCLHDWSLLPCAKHGKCFDCGELFLEKGNAAQRREAELVLAESADLLRLAEQEFADGTYGANNYVNHNRRMVAGASRALAIHADEALADGTLVHLNPKAPSLFELLEADGESASASHEFEADGRAAGEAFA